MAPTGQKRQTELAKIDDIYWVICFRPLDYNRMVHFIHCNLSLKRREIHPRNKQITVRFAQSRSRISSSSVMPPPPIAAAATALPAAHLARVVAASGSGGATPPRAAPRRGRRGKPGFSRRSAIKKSFHQEQVVFSTPVPADPTVAVIGGGASGLSCASALAARGVRSVVFDTVRNAPLGLPSPASPASTSAGGRLTAQARC